MEVQKVCLKVPVVGSVDVDAVQKSFAAWIRKDSLPGILIDVADYSHMVNGPGVILVAHEFIFSLDDQDGVRGLRVSMRLPSDKALSVRVAETLDLLKTGASLLKQELGLQIDGAKIEICVLDRLNSEAQTPKVLTEALATVLKGHSLTKTNASRDARRLPGIELAVSPAISL
jgi:hypothetical protein